jgi:DNA-binding beta-propeller fold protein YncE
MIVTPVLACGAFRARAADHPQPFNGVFATPLTDAAIDNTSLAEWCAGNVLPIADPNAIRQRVWTQSTMPVAGAYLKYGSCTQTGPRHLRIGFRTPVPVGTVLVRGSGQLSVLRAGAAYPGNMADDSQWIPAQHVLDRQVSTAPVDLDNYAVWILPPGTQTRALRFTHVAAVTDSYYVGMMGSFYILSGRFANLAPEATVLTSSNAGAASQLVDEKYGEFRTWDNGPDFAQPVSAANPEWVVLSWPHAVVLNGLAALWAGFNAADAQVFTGPESVSLHDAPETDWHAVGQPYALRNQYPLLLGVDWMDFGKTIQTRAVRLRMTAATDESRHVHLAGKTDNGKRVWLGELMALSPLDSKDLQAAILPAASTTPNAPIPVHFTLPAAGFVSLVIDDAQGNRVRNLVSDTYFPAGSNTAWWDGADDLGRDRDAADHGQYLIPTHFVAPGHYQVRGLVHQAIDLHYEFSLYDPGYPAWETLDTTGGWLTSHTPASSALFLPADKAPGGKPLVYLGCWYAEGGAGLAWMNLDGVKQGGRAWIGNDWTAAEFLARDTGAHADPAVYAYTGAIWGNPKGQGDVLGTAIVRIFGLTAKGDKPILSYSFDTGERPANQEAALVVWKQQLGGIAVHDGVAVASLTKENRLLFVNAITGKTIGQASLDSPRGLAFDSQGRLLALSSGRLLRYAIPSQMALLSPQQLGQPEVLVASGLEDPSGITLDISGNIYVSDKGSSNQVKVFSPAGKLLQSIGHAGPSKAGPYDPLHMNSPRGMTIDSNNHLWVAEDDFQPKRVSVWTLDGKLVKSFEGSAEYGGGGSLDPTDKTKYYYHGMEFKLDWQAGKDSLAAVLYRPSKDEIPLPRYGTPASVLHSHGHRYFDNTFLANTTTGSDVALLYLDTGGIIRPVAALGKANAWDLLKSDAFRPLWPAGTDASSPQPKDSLLFTWSDTNNNGKVDPSEVTFLKAVTGSITVMSDLAMIDSYVDGKAMRYVPIRLTPEGVPVYDLQHGEAIIDGAQQRSSDGGGQLLYSPSAIVSTTAPLPFARDGVGGVDAQNHRWSYPSLWPGLHPSHSAPVPDHPGELIGATRLLGDFIHPAGEDAGPLWAINGNFGPMYVFTADGLYVTQLFQDYRTGKPWIMPRPVRNMLLNDVSAHEENFFPSITQMPDGNVYLIDGGRTSIVRVDGLSNIHRLPAAALDVTKAQLDQAQAQQRQAALSRLQQQGPPTLDVSIGAGTADLTQLFNTLKNQKWAVIDNRITQVGWARHPDVSEAAVMVAGNRLVAAFRTQDANLLSNSGTNANAPFKTGGALDLMIGADPHANPVRGTPVAGDIRLLVYQVNGATKATLYRAVVSGAHDPVPFTSPLRTITLDRVDDVSSQVELKAMTGDAAGSFIFSIPLATLGLKPEPGEKIKADVGILRGNGQQTVQRVYWSNKTTGITSDVPSEAELIPSLWGEWIFKAAQ